MYKTNKINTILFDMDGTVLASEELFGISELRLLKTYGVHANLNDLVEFRGTSEDRFYPLFIKKFKLKDTYAIVQQKLHSILFETFKDSLQYIIGFKEFYDDIISKHHIKTAIVTNTSIEIVNHIRRCINIDDYFNLYITASDVSSPKPSPIPYLNAIHAIQSNPMSTVIIEDSSSGLISALSTTAQVVALTTTLSSKEIENISEEIIICSNYGEIKNFLQDKV